jgi:hypothetical protein
MENESQIVSETNLFKMYGLPTAWRGSGSLHQSEAQATSGVGKGTVQPLDLGSDLPEQSVDER